MASAQAAEVVTWPLSPGLRELGDNTPCSSLCRSPGREEYQRAAAFKWFLAGRAALEACASWQSPQEFSGSVN